MGRVKAPDDRKIDRLMLVVKSFPSMERSHVRSEDSIQFGEAPACRPWRQGH